ncbi:MAG: sugar phosphate isomerase/epimerase [Alicyclobacillus sp.]|nr:sugar phosphate isomerase/epimerase [Alicyclobacillus sp.]
MKIAYSNLACPEWSMEQVMAHAAEYGYDGVEIRLLAGQVIPATLDAATRQEICRLARQHDIDIIGLGASTQFAMADVQEHDRQVQSLLAYIELASAMEVPFVRTFGGGGNPADLPAELRGELVSRVADGLNQVAARAEALGVAVLLETHDAFCSSAMVRDVLQQVPSPAIGALWDTHHPYRVGETAAETYGNLADRLRHVHIKDARRNADGWDLVLLGQGEVPVRDIVQLLVRTGYDKYLSIEWERKWHPEIEPADVALPQHLEVLRGYLREAGADGPR